MNTKPARAFGVMNANGHLYPATYWTAKQAKAGAATFCMGGGDYHRLGTDEKRWKHCHKNGYRVVRVLITTEPKR